MSIDLLGRDGASMPEILSKTQEAALRFLASLNDRPPSARLADHIAEPLPERGVGAEAAADAFRARYEPQLSGAVGPRYWAFIPGGVTPAALAGDWLASTYDQFSQLLGDTAAPHVEAEAISWLRALFALPDTFEGAFVTGGTMANFVGLAIGRQREGRRHGADIAEAGVAAAPPFTVLSGAAHSSICKGLSMLGIGRARLEVVPSLEGREAVDVSALAHRLEALRGSPAIVVANAGTVNSVDFDDLAAIGALKSRYAFHLHVDAAFGAFAAASPKYRHLMNGAEAADSIAADCHKWLNVPYDSGVCFTRHTEDQIATFKNVSAYLAAPTIAPMNYLHLGPENSRRLRALPAWMTLKAYGREGYRSIVETSCELAAEFARRIDAAPGFRLFAPARLNVVCFQYLRGGIPADGPDLSAFLDRLHADGRLRLGPSRLFGHPILRAAFVNWRTSRKDIDIALAALAASA